jgi:hypothetical protein
MNDLIPLADEGHQPLGQLILAGRVGDPLLAQAVAFGYRIGEISCPTKCFPEASSINFRRSVVYGLGALGSAVS